MTSFSSRAVLHLGLLAGLVAGCTHSGSGEGAVEPRPELPPGSTVSSEEIRRAPAESIEAILAGRVSGVWVARSANGGFSVRIRGVTSFYGNNEPLYVLDGVPFQPGPGGSLLGISPHDIESIEVLKNPIDTSMYGMRGANGVILIRTKRPDQ